MAKTNAERLKLTDVINSGDFAIAFGTFLDGFKQSENKYELIENPPQAENADEVNLCVLAATSHKLANDYGLPVPKWVHDPFYVMSYPVFSHDTKKP